MKRFALITTLLLTLVLLFALAGEAAAELKTPKPPANFYCLDEAGILGDATEQAVVNTSRALQSQTGAQIVVLTVKTLEDAPVQDYALQVFRDWGIGDKTKNNGVLILIAMKERKSRIEIGYGLEGALPDAKTGRIMDDNLIPYFAQGKYDEGIINTYNALLAEINKEYGVSISPINPGQTASKVKTTEKSSWAKYLGIALFILIAIFLGRRGIFIGGPFGGGGFGGGGGGDFGGGGSGGGGGADRDW